MSFHLFHFLRNFPSTGIPSFSQGENTEPKSKLLMVFNFGMRQRCVAIYHPPSEVRWTKYHWSSPLFLKKEDNNAKFQLTSSLISFQMLWIHGELRPVVLLMLYLQTSPQYCSRWTYLMCDYRTSVYVVDECSEWMHLSFFKVRNPVFILGPLLCIALLIKENCASKHYEIPPPTRDNGFQVQHLCAAAMSSAAMICTTGTDTWWDWCLLVFNNPSVESSDCTDWSG